MPQVGENGALPNGENSQIGQITTKERRIAAEQHALLVACGDVRYH